jgi:hypothetical protein
MGFFDNENRCGHWLKLMVFIVVMWQHWFKVVMMGFSQVIFWPIPTAYGYFPMMKSVQMSQIGFP